MDYGRLGREWREWWMGSEETRIQVVDDKRLTSESGGEERI